MSWCYILDGKQPVKAKTMGQWVKWFEGADRAVRKTDLPGCVVSTVFLGLDHSFVGGEPLLFETMVFDGPLDGEQDRCSTWEQAEAMHEAMCRRVREAG